MTNRRALEDEPRESAATANLPVPGAPKLRVLLTHELFAPDFRGGGEVIVTRVAEGLAGAGCAVNVLTTGSPGGTKNEGIAIRRLPMSRYRLNLAVRAIVADARSADLIHTFNYHAALPSLLAGAYLRKPVVCTYLGLFGDAWLDLRGRLAGRLWRGWERAMVKLPYARLLFLSDFSRDLAISLGADPRRSRVVEPGLEEGLFSPARVKEDVVLFAGKFEARKGTADVVAAARALPHVQFRMLGGGPEEDRLRREAPANLDIHGQATRSEVAAEMARARVFLFPSRAETFGLVIVEAMAAGCAIVASVPLPFEGVRVRAGDVQGIVTAIGDLWSDEERTRRLGAENIRLSRGYTWDAHIARLLQIYSQVLSVR
jgi:glycosyltransferase involved in cell wall biosynthesis